MPHVLKMWREWCKLKDVQRWQIILCYVGWVKIVSYMTVYGVTAPYARRGTFLMPGKKAAKDAF